MGVVGVFVVSAIVVVFAVVVLVGVAELAVVADICMVLVVLVVPVPVPFCQNMQDKEYYAVGMVVAVGFRGSCFNPGWRPFDRSPRWLQFRGRQAAPNLPGKR